MAIGTTVTDEDLLTILRLIGDGDAAGAPMDSDGLSRRLGWTPGDVAARLQVARERMLIWGIRTGGTPAPRYSDLEITVQGRRLMASTDPAPT